MLELELTVFHGHLISNFLHSRIWGNVTAKKSFAQPEKPAFPYIQPLIKTVTRQAKSHGQMDKNGSLCYCVQRAHWRELANKSRAGHAWPAAFRGRQPQDGGGGRQPSPRRQAQHAAPLGAKDVRDESPVGSRRTLRRVQRLHGQRAADRAAFDQSHSATNKSGLGCIRARHRRELSRCRSHDAGDGQPEHAHTGFAVRGVCPRAHRDGGTASSSSTRPSTAAGSVWQRSRSTSWWASAWIGASTASRPCAARSLPGRVVATTFRPKSTGNSQPRMRTSSSNGFTRQLAHDATLGGSISQSRL